MATLMELSPEVRVEVPDCPIGLINKTLINILRDFCWKTHHWQHAMASITLLPYNASAPDTYIYTLPLPSNTELIDIHSLVYEGLPLRMQSPSWLDEHQDKWREASGEPKHYILLSNKQVRFIPASDQVRPQAISGMLALRPTRTTNTFDDSIMEFDQAIVNGAIARLLIMPKQLWSDSRRAGVCQVAYQDGISLAKMQVLKGYSDGVEMAAQRSWL